MEGFEVFFTVSGLIAIGIWLIKIMASGNDPSPNSSDYYWYHQAQKRGRK